MIYFKLSPQKTNTGIFILITLAVLASFVNAQDLPKPDLIARVSQYQGMPAIELEVRLGEGWHMTSHQPKDEFAFGAEVELANSSDPKALKIRQSIWPEPTVKFIESIGIESSFYEGTFVVILVLNGLVDLNNIRGQEVILHYQSCTQSLCLSPDNISTLVVEKGLLD
tara:strand:- start:1563 stop:2066 length:504 start_codon:yes stop_codon:yes gene_type:complete